MSPPASERGGHARPRGPFAPRPRDSGDPGPHGGGAPGQRDAIPPPPADPGRPRSPRPVRPHRPVRRNTRAERRRTRAACGHGRPADPRAGAGPARHVAPGPAARPGRKSSPAIRRAKRSRIAALAIVVVGVLVIGLATGFGSELSAEPTAQAFLLDWQQQQYAAAGALTTAAPGTVTADLRGAFAQLDATQLFLTMKSVVQHGDTAEASFMATVDLAQQGRVWTYQRPVRPAPGRRQLEGRVGAERRQPEPGPGGAAGRGDAVPGPGAGARRQGRSASGPAPAYVLGVWPGTPVQPGGDGPGLRQPRPNCRPGRCSARSRPPRRISSSGSPRSTPPPTRACAADLHDVPGLVVRPESQRLFQAKATGLVGEVGSEINEQLRAEGALYAPGTTVGLSGLEQAYQRQLLGTPTTEVVVVNSAGAQTGVLAQWPGAAGTPVRTTINSSGAERGPDRPRRRVQLRRDRRRPGVDRRGPGGRAAPGVRRPARGGRAEREADAGHRVHHRVRRRAGQQRAEDGHPDLVRELLHRRRADLHQRRDR